MVLVKLDRSRQMDASSPSQHQLLVVFPSGLVGCPDWRRFVLIEDDEIPDLCLLQSLDEAAIAFPVARVEQVEPAFYQGLSTADRDALTMCGYGRDGVDIFCIVHLHATGEVTANLMGPLVIDRSQTSGTQVVLTTSRWPTRHAVTMLG